MTAPPITYFRFFKIVVSFHYFFLLTESTHKMNMSVTIVSLAIFSNSVGMLANENVSKIFSMKACNKTRTIVYRKNEANPI